MTRSERRRYNQSVLDSNLLGLPPSCPYHSLKNMILGNRLFSNVRVIDTACLTPDGVATFERILKRARDKRSKKHYPPEPHLNMKGRLFFLRNIYSFFRERLLKIDPMGKLYLIPSVHNRNFTGNKILGTDGSVGYVVHIPQLYHRDPEHLLRCYYDLPDRRGLHLFALSYGHITLGDKTALDNFFPEKKLKGTIEEYLAPVREDLRAAIKFLKRDHIYKTRGYKKKARFHEPNHW